MERRLRVERPGYILVMNLIRVSCTSSFYFSGKPPSTDGVT